MYACCPLGEKLDDPHQVLFETDNFFVAPGIGGIGIEGYLLVLSKDCFKGTGDIPESDHKELDEVVRSTKKVLKEVYGVESLVFEHGPRVCGVRGGGCLDHAHLHVVPGANVMDDLAVDLMHRLGDTGHFYRVDKVEGFQRVADIYHGQTSSYLMAEAPDGKRLVTEVNIPIPSQYMRRLIAKKLGVDTWDWAKHPDLNLFERTVSRLHGKF